MHTCPYLSNTDSLWVKLVNIKGNINLLFIKKMCKENLNLLWFGVCLKIEWKRNEFCVCGIHLQYSVVPLDGKK